MLASLFGALIAIGSLLTLINMIAAEDAAERGRVLQGSGITLMVVLVSYIISRTRHYRLSLLPFTVGFVGITISSALQQTESILLPVYLIVPVLVWSVFFSLRATSLMAAIILGVNAVLIISASEASAIYLINSTQLFLVILGVLLAITHHRNRLENIRQQRLVENEERLQSYFDNANDWIFMLDAKGLISYVNQQMCIASGYRADEFIGRDPLSFLQLRDVPPTQEALQAILMGNAVSQFEVEVPLRNGRCIWLEIRGSILEQDGLVNGTFHIARDITARKQAEQAERARRQMAETLYQTSVVLNSTLSLNEVLTRILDELGRTLPFDSASVQQREGEALRLRAVKGFSNPEKLLNQILPIDSTYPNSFIATERKPLAIDDVTIAYPHFQDESDKYQSAYIHSWLGVPLVVNDELMGIVTVDRHEIRPFTPDEIALATTFANHAAIALHNARLYERLARNNETLETAVFRRTAELQHTTNQFEAILTNSPDAILQLNPDLTIELSNPAFTKMFGYKKGEPFANFPACLVVAQDLQKFMRAINLAAQMGHHTRIEFTAQRKDKTTFDADMAIAPIHKPDEANSILCSIRDITQLKEVERAKDDFVSNVSHELRTPITNLKLYHDLLQLNPIQQEKYIPRLRREIDRLHTIIENLLNLSRLDQGRVNWEITQVDLNELAQQIVTDRTPLAREKQITLTCLPTPDLVNIHADANHLSQVISILFTNALTYTPAGGEITLQTHQQVDQEETWVGISVQDTGPGIPKDEQSHIFERFYRGSAGRASGAPGTGLGLAIASEIIKWHQGKIEVTSPDMPHHGATFTVWLSFDRQLSPQDFHHMS
ncbi:MAG: PAS domain S-box protein [Ardenticatenaceae bacterium]|nr:PAS domain S-box protein [Ardenticatenaceae bacterium]